MVMSCFARTLCAVGVDTFAIGVDTFAIGVDTFKGALIVSAHAKSR
jgi:hypothetical protein